MSVNIIILTEYTCMFNMYTGVGEEIRFEKTEGNR